VTDERVDTAKDGWLSGLYRWFTGAAVSETDTTPSRIGHYVIRQKIGAGGMGVVYEAHDPRLDRSVALKMMLGLERDDTGRKRFWREARAAASINHPNVCQIYEVGEASGQLFIAMELLDGEPLAEHLQNGALSVDRAVPIAIDILNALGAIHTRGIIHRDLKPSNIFLTQHGVKLLDFGLARVESAPDSAVGLTRSGIAIGTPRYMAPEVVTGEPVDARSDLFAVGAILFEMLAGRPAFVGRTIAEVLNATLTEQPPALTGSPAVAAADRVIRRALAKKPAGRPSSAMSMAEELNAVRGIEGHDMRGMAHALTRVVVLPFRVLRPDPDIDFLAFSLPDAITTSLAGIRSLVVRSSATAARFAAEAPDIKALAADADVDRVVTGTLLRSGDQLRAATQLIEAPAGTVLTSHTVQSALGDLFRMQDDIARQLVDALALPLTGERPSPSPSPDAPVSPAAYELYLRANGLGRNYDAMQEARTLYEQCLELDPTFAPAWAHLGRCHRVIGKFIEPSPDSDARAEEAFKRAIALNPRLSVAHKFYANLEADTGRAREAIVRLLREATRNGNDAELFAGLVHACRYSGLFEESLAAHAEARRLDPHIATGAQQTLLLKRDIERLLAFDTSDREPGADEGIHVIALGLSGRRDEARQALASMGQRSHIQLFHRWTAHLRAWLDRHVDDMVSTLVAFGSLKIFDDPEAIFQEGWLFCDVGDHERGLSYLQRAVARGYFVAPTLARWPQFDALREVPAFQALLAEAEAGRERARHAFRDAGGDRLLAR